jgi:hypothetical protein
MDADGEQQQQGGDDEQLDEALALVPAAAAAGEAAAAPASCGTVLAQLLGAVIPKLMLDWALPTSQDSALYSNLISSILASSKSSNSSTAAPVAAGTSLAAAGAAAFTFDDVGVLERHLAPAAPAAVHTALVAPFLRLQGHPASLGSPGWEDTSLAYVLLQQQRDDGMPVSDWFGLFCEALALKGFQQGEGQGGEGDADLASNSSLGGAAGGVLGAAAGRAVRSRARRGLKARGYAAARDGDAAVAAAAAAGSGGRHGKQQQTDQDQARPATAKGGKKRGGAAAGAAAGSDVAEVDQEELLAAAARFSQAAAELQLLGVWKGTKRRRAAGVLRVFAPEGPSLPSMAAAAAAAGRHVDVE